MPPRPSPRARPPREWVRQPEHRAHLQRLAAIANAAAGRNDQGSPGSRRGGALLGARRRGVRPPEEAGVQEVRPVQGGWAPI